MRLNRPSFPNKTDAVGGTLQGVFKQSYAPTNQNDGQQAKAFS